MNRIALLLLVLGPTFATVLCRAADPNTRQAQAIAELQKVGGIVIHDEKIPGKPVVAVDLGRDWIRLRPDGSIMLRPQSVTAAKVTDAGLEHLKELTTVKAINLTGSDVTDAGLGKFTALTNLQSLGLAHTKVTDAALAQIAGLAELQELDLSNTKVTGVGLAHLNRLHHLRALNMFNTSLSSAGLRRVGSLTSLRSLNLGLDVFIAKDLEHSQVTEGA